MASPGRGHPFCFVRQGVILDVRYVEQWVVIRDFLGPQPL